MILAGRMGLAGPDEPDFERFSGGADPPASERTGWGPHTDGNRCRDRVDGGLEHQRKARQRAMHVELRQRISIGDDLFDARHLPKQADHLGGADEDNLSAPTMDQRNVANELKCIAEALLGVEEDTFASQIAAIPTRLRKCQARLA